MSGVSDVNRELTRLDAELRAGGIDRSTFRSKRRKLLLDFEERQTTTTPGALTGNEVTLVDAPIDLPFALPSVEPAPAKTASTRRGSPAIGIAALAIGAIVVLALGAWWMFKPRPESVAVPSAPPSASPALGSEPMAGPETPQLVASALLDTEWTDADVADFLQRWGQLSPEAIASATEDSRIWLLRGETDRRLREAREAESVEHSAQVLVRVKQLEQLQAAIRSP